MLLSKQARCLPGESDDTIAMSGRFYQHITLILSIYISSIFGQRRGTVGSYERKKQVLGMAIAIERVGARSKTVARQSKELKRNIHAALMSIIENLSVVARYR